MKMRFLLMLFAAAMSVIALATAPVSAGVVFSEDFESPVVTGYSEGTDPGGWIGADDGYGSGWRGLYNEDTGDFTTPYGDQAYYLRYTNSGLTTAESTITEVLEADVTYNITFNAAILNTFSTGTYLVEFVAFNPGDDRTECRGERLGTILATASGIITSSDMSASDSIVFTPNGSDPSLGKLLGIRLIKASGTMLYDNIKLLIGHDFQPSPEDGVTVPGGSVGLNWTNMPANVGSDVWVDVWFGTNPITDFSKVVNAGQNTTSTYVTAPSANTYYWRVDTYREGSPGGQPEEGDLFVFYVTDTDGDGFPDTYELANTNPPSATALNPNDDLDSDGLTNMEEYGLGTNPNLADTDSDTLLDGDEIVGAGSRPITDPLDADSDDDGLNDGVETNTGTWVSSSDTGTDPTDADKDKDGLKDGVETNTGYFVDKNDTGTDPYDADCDNDGAGDWYEITAAFTDPLNASDVPGIPYPLPDPDGSSGNSSPVKVYIMSGQSNMVGIGFVNGGAGSLETIAKNENKFPNLVDAANNWTVRNDVWYEGVVTATAKQWLGPGCGSSSTTLGPELGFGHVMGWYHDEPVILIKTSQGNRSLGWDFLPPGSTRYDYNGYTYAGYGDSPDKWLIGEPNVPIAWYAGLQYDQCVEEVHNVLDNFATKFPQYAAQGYEIAGFVWWQGHKDQLGEPYASRYEMNMVNFVNSIRAEFSAPNAPFVLGTIGFGGWDMSNPTTLEVADAQLAVSGENGIYPAFANNVYAIETRSYWRQLSESPGTQDYHYNNNAETYMLVGDALGRGMIKLLTGGVPTDTNPPAPETAAFYIPPTAINSVSVTMTAMVGTDATDPVEYLFTETSGNPGGTSSGWQLSPVYTDTGLNPDTQYTYTVTMRDSAFTRNEGTASAAANVTTDPIDTFAPTPDPATFDVAPYALTSSSISMTATIGTDSTGPVEYLFTETSGNPGGTSSNWQLSPAYSDNGLAPDTQYTYTVTMRDSLGNAGTASGGQSATTYTEAAAGSDAITLVASLNALRDHITGTATLSGPEIESYKLTIDSLYGHISDHSSAVSACRDLVETYDSLVGPLFVLGSPVQSFSRSSTSDQDINWAVYCVMQHLMDVVYNSTYIPLYDFVFDGFKFGTADFFPGYAPQPADPEATYTVTVNASHPDTWGHDTMYTTGPARRATGAYVVPGSTAMITVPSSIVGKGYNIRVCAHSWDFSAKPTIKRMDRSSVFYAIDSTTVEVASPIGGGIYIEVPQLASGGLVDITIKNFIRSPFYRNTSFDSTTLADWQNIERSHPAPWADFQSEKFMMNLPTDWIYAYDDPVTAMADWDESMDALNDLMGYPTGQAKETMYPQIDLFMKNSVYAPGYPSVNSTYNPNTSYGGNVDNYYTKGPRVATLPDYQYHEQGHGYLFQKFGGESESNVNLLHVAVYNDKFGYDLDYSFASSRGFQGNPHRTLDNTAIAWMCSFNFAPYGNPMADGEKAYQLKGHAKFVDIARLFGWQTLGDFWYSFNEDYENSVTIDTSNDGLIIRLAKAVGVDIRPLLHFWGIHPSDPVTLAAAIAAENLPQSAAIYDTLSHYRVIVPVNNTAYQTYAYNWWGHVPSIGGNWTEREHTRQWDTTDYWTSNGWTYAGTDPGQADGEIYTEASCARIQAVVDGLLATYFPGGRPGGAADTDPPTPNPATFAVSPAADSDTAISMTATTGSDVTGPVQYLFTETSGNPGGTSSSWQTSPSYTDTGLTPATQYIYTVTMRDGIGNTGAASVPSNATTQGLPDTDPPTPNPAAFAVSPTADSDTAISMTATSGTDVSGPVEYLFTETSGNPGGTSSAWQTSASYTDSGLTASTQYTYTVTMRDSLGNTGTASSPANATTLSPPEYDPPTPNPMTWASVPTAFTEQTLFSEDFESPVAGDDATVSTYTQTAPTGWVRASVGFGSTQNGLNNVSGNQVYSFRYTNSGVTTAEGIIGVYQAGVTYTLSFDVIADRTLSELPYYAQLMTFNTGEDRGDIDTGPSGTILASAQGNAPADGSWENVSFEYTAQPADAGKDISIRFDGATTTANIDNVLLRTGVGSGPSITMTATIATDASGVEYYFDELTGNPGGDDSGWQDSPTYVDGDLSPGTQYTYTVTARDKSVNQNTTAPSTAESATTTGGSGDPVPDVVGMTQANAEAAIVAAGFTVGTITTAYSDTVAAGDVISQDPTAGTPTAAGAPVDIEVSLGVEMVTVPNVVGLAQATAEANIVAAQLVVGNVTTDYSDTVPTGDVISQNPTGGASVVHDSAVDIVVSLGVEMVTVPNVVGLAQATAEANIVAAQLVVGNVTTDYSDTVPTGDVISQNPTGGASVVHDSAVDIVVSLGVEMVTVPNVVGLAQATAEANIVAAQLVVGNVTTDYSDTVPTGDVISQNPTGGASVVHDSAVDIVVSLGVEMVTVPNVVGLAQATAEANIVAAQLVVGNVTTDYSDTVPTGDVISQNPTGGASVVHDSAVDIVVSLGVQMVTVPNVVGQAQATAEANIVAAQLVVGNVTTAYSGTVPVGDVISQNPTGGASVVHDSAVDIVVSLGVQMVTVPNVVGQAQATAEANIVAAQLVVGNVTTASSPTVPAGDVISQNPAGSSSAAIGSSVDIVVSTGPAATPPAAPSSLSATAISKTEIDISWTDNATNETGFKIERSDRNNANFVQIATVGANVTSFSDTGLKKNTTYYYRVRATNASGDSAYSNEASDTTPK